MVLLDVGRSALMIPLNSGIRYLTLSLSEEIEAIADVGNHCWCGVRIPTVLNKRVIVAE